MITIPDAQYVPDLDSPRIAGALIDMQGFAPTQRGQYASVSLNSVFAVANTDVLRAQTFRQVDDSVRFLVFRGKHIDEYSSAGVKTARILDETLITGTGWDVAAWGNQIIAVNYEDVPQSSTGAEFTDLAGTPPKARCIASNVNFVMLADVDDSGSNVFSDMVWWSGLQNPETWAASIATQAGYVRLLDAPGPIKRLVAYKDKFIAFKENAIFVGEYIGPPLLFQWRLVSSRIGLSAPQAIVELDDKLYFAHASGVYEFDGANLRNVGLPVWQTILNTFGFTGINAPSSGPGTVPSPASGYAGTPISYLRMIGDDIDGVVWLACYTQRVLTAKYYMHIYGYNVRTGKWAKAGGVVAAATSPPVLVNTTHADMRTFLDTAMPAQARAWYVDNIDGLYDIRYPDAWVAELPGTITTAVQGSPDGSSTAVRVYTRCVEGSDETPFSAGTFYGWTNEQRTAGAQQATCILNTEFESLDGLLNARFKQAHLSASSGKTCILAGVGIEYPPTGRR